MTLEEKAEKYVCDIVLVNPYPNINGNRLFNSMDMRTAYIMGAKENGVVWHDLRKDPNDLPTEGAIVCLAYTNKRYELITYQGEVLSDADYGIIAWCEIPKFEED